MFNGFNLVDVLSSVALLFTAPFRSRGGQRGLPKVRTLPKHRVKPFPPAPAPSPMTPVSQEEMRAAQRAMLDSFSAILKSMLKQVNTQIRLLDFILAAGRVSRGIVWLSMAWWMFDEVWVHAFQQSISWLGAGALLIVSCSWLVPLALQGVLRLVQRILRAQHLRQIRALEAQRKAAEAHYNELRKRVAYQFFRSLEQESYRTYYLSQPASQPASQPSQPNDWV